ncbi:hypothetical protein VTN02DRAFT_1882 [Thermoascus thermophilus]
MKSQSEKCCLPLPLQIEPPRVNATGTQAADDTAKTNIKTGQELDRGAQPRLAAVLAPVDFLQGQRDVLPEIRRNPWTEMLV